MKERKLSRYLQLIIVRRLPQFIGVPHMEDSRLIKTKSESSIDALQVSVECFNLFHIQNTGPFSIYFRNSDTDFVLQILHLQMQTIVNHLI